MSNNQDKPNAVAYRDLCGLGRGLWNTADIAARMLLHAIGLQEGSLSEPPEPPKDENGGP